MLPRHPTNKLCTSIGELKHAACTPKKEIYKMALLIINTSKYANRCHWARNHNQNHTRQHSPHKTWRKGQTSKTQRARCDIDLSQVSVSEGSLDQLFPSRTCIVSVVAKESFTKSRVLPPPYTPFRPPYIQFRQTHNTRANKNSHTRGGGFPVPPLTPTTLTLRSQKQPSFSRQRKKGAHDRIRHHRLG